MTFFLFFIFAWVISAVKNNLFFVYLWQLKEYHVARFLSHFSTDKGKKIFLSKFWLAKTTLLLLSSVLYFTENFNGEKPILSASIWMIFALYLAEATIAILKGIKKQLKLPKFTLKSGLVSAAAVFATFLFVLFVFGFQNYAKIILWLTAFDVLSIAITSAVVLIIQPFIVLYRNIFIIGKARKIIESRNDLITIGITGSYGKTSTKEFLSAILAQKFRVLKTEEHKNSEMGISGCIIKNLKNNTQIFVAEMGAYGKGGIKLLSSIVKPKIGILTGINSQHISLFGSQETIINTKYELIEALPKNGLAVFNGDNQFCADLYNKTTDKNKKIYKTDCFVGLPPRNDDVNCGNSSRNSIARTVPAIAPDIWAENVKVEKDKIIFTAVEKGREKAELIANILGGQNIGNLLGAIVVARYLGMSFEEIKQGMEKITGEQGPLKLLGKNTDPYILDSTYSANPDGVLSDLEYLKTWSGKKAIIMPCLIELGEGAKKIHEEIGKKIGEVCDLAIITTLEYFEEIKKSAERGIKKTNVIYSENPDNIINQINIFSSPGDVALLEGRIPLQVINQLNKK